MLLPKHIEKKLLTAANHARRMTALMAQVNEWFESKGFSAEDLRSGNGVSLEEFEYGSKEIEPELLLEEFKSYLDTLEASL